MNSSMIEINESEFEQISGGTPLIAFAPAFVEGVKWGAATVVAIYGAYKAAQ